MNKKTQKKVKKTVKKGYNSAKKTAKKNGKLKQFYIAIVIILIIAIAAGLAYYFLVVKPNQQNVQAFQFDTFVDIDNTGSIVEDRGKLQVHFINVDQADCTLIMLPDGRNMLIDAGDNDKPTEKHIKEYLERFNIKTIDYMMLTHADSDHVGSMDFVLDNYEIKNIFMPKLLPTYKAGTEQNRYSYITPDMVEGTISTKVYYDFVTRADDETYIENGEKKDTNLFPNVDFMEIKGNDYVIEIYCMGNEMYDRKLDDSQKKNEISPTVLLKYEGRQILFTGDSCGTSHDNFVKMYRERYINTGLIKKMDFDVYKAAHHGSGTHGSNNKAFLKEIKTEYAVLSCKAGKYTGKNPIPHPTTINDLKDMKNKVYRTDICGDIKLEVENGGVIDFTADSSTDNDTIFTKEELIEEDYALPPVA